MKNGFIDASICMGGVYLLANVYCVIAKQISDYNVVVIIVVKYILSFQFVCSLKCLN